ncbi:hypothetical protein SLEP1_g22572 [Rubroshorea leprosula]|uniref:Cation/H+ exchanger domain-containing protein n=2 Tax=Rubroshorea leprosula TaxID=152421 RepID=A0AAV5JCM0_9ROSI|nr:hypothetical protein SLEP1_g22572 [Rubroshorea leprosula]
MANSTPTTIPMSYQTPNITFGIYLIVNDSQNEFTVCFNRTQVDSNITWQISNPVMKSLPMFAIQLSLVLFVLRLFMFILGPLRQPRFVAEILTGIVLGPTLLGQFPKYRANFAPFEGVLVMETLANLGLTFYMFVVGLEMDLMPLRKIESKALNIALAGILGPTAIGIGLYFMLEKFLNASITHTPIKGAIFWAIILTLTSFPDLARILSDLKLLHTDLGKTALTSAIINDLTAWLLLVGTVSAINGRQNIFAVVPTMLFILTYWILLRPVLGWIIQRTASTNGTSVEGKYSDTHVFFILIGVVISGFISDFCGSHSMIGAFMFGLIIPGGDLGTKIMDRIEEYITGIMLPPVFFVTGLRANLRDHLFPKQMDNFVPFIVVLVIILACSAKIVSTFIVSLFLNISSQDALALGILMNTKGVLAIIVLNEGRSLKGINNQTFATMMVSILIMTAMVNPIVGFFHKATRRLRRFQLRTLEKNKQDSELRVLVGVHSLRNASGLISLLQISNATPKSPMAIFFVHLVELTGRASAMLVFHDTHHKHNYNYSTLNREKADVDQIISIFQSYERDNIAVSVQPLTAVSPYTTMHEYISSFAEDKGVTIILLPFHKKQGNNDDQNPEHRQVNKNLLETAPCSVGILVDRGLQASLHGDSQHNAQKCYVAMFFIEGRDDREALAYAWRMARCPGVVLTVVRFIAGKAAEDMIAATGNYDDDKFLVAMTERQDMKQMDDRYVNEFRFRAMCDQSIKYMEKRVDSADHIVQSIRSTYSDMDLYIVGRGEGVMPPLISGLSGWSDCPELGALGETLVAAEFTSHASILVVQQGKSAWKRSVMDQKGKLGINSVGSNTLIVNHKKGGDLGNDD